MRPKELRCSFLNPNVTQSKPQDGASNPVYIKTRTAVTPTLQKHDEERHAAGRTESGEEKERKNIHKVALEEHNNL